MDRSPETPREDQGDRPLSQTQLNQAYMHNWRIDMQSTGVMGIPLAIIAASLGNVPLAIGASALSAVTLSLAALQAKVEKNRK